jgi:hypothetical protein
LGQQFWISSYNHIKIYDGVFIDQKLRHTSWLWNCNVFVSVKRKAIFCLVISRFEKNKLIMFVKMQSTLIPWHLEYSDQGHCTLLHLLCGLADVAFPRQLKSKSQKYRDFFLNITFVILLRWFLLDTKTSDQLILIGTCLLHHYSLLYKEIWE